MNYRVLGATGLCVSEVGFGGWGIGGTQGNVPAYGPTDDRESKRALVRAYELGVTFYDTADLYGDGHSEELIGTVFKKMRDKVIIASKAGFVNATGEQNFSIAHLEKAVEGTLRRLQTDYVDLYQIHSAPMDLLEKDESILDFFHRLQKKGMVRAVGIAVKSPEDGLRAVRDFGFKAVQVNFNMIDQRILENGLLELCGKENAGVIARTPLCYGFLTGRYSAASDFGPGDHRSGKSRAQLERWANAYELFHSVIPRDERRTDAQTAIQYCLSYRAVSTVIPGLLTPEHVEENVRASELGPLSDDEKQGAERIYQENTFFVG